MDAFLAIADALAHPTRVRVLELLNRQEIKGCAAGEIAAALGVRPTTLSSHLSVMVRAGIIRSDRDGKSIVYRLQPGGLRKFLAQLTSLALPSTSSEPVTIEKT